MINDVIIMQSVKFWKIYKTEHLYQRGKYDCQHVGIKAEGAAYRNTPESGL